MDGRTSLRTELYPALEPYERGRLALDARHTMYWEVCGNPHGVPVVFLHGGPGGGCAPDHRRFFDPAFFRIVLFDQRGAGRSTPAAEIRDNTTQHLVEDMEALRRQLGVERWLVFGGSWGSTLALAYGQAHPNRCLGFVLRGIFLGRPCEIEWFLHGLRTVHPEAWRDWIECLPIEERGEPLQGYLARLTDPDPLVHEPFAQAWSAYEGLCSTLLPNPGLVRHLAEGALALARIEAYYFAQRCFLAPDQLLADLDRIRSIPAAIVQGRYDMVCPIRSADALARAWPEARYVIVPAAGHSVWEPAVCAAVVGEVEAMKALLVAHAR